MKILNSDSVDILFQHLCGSKNTVGHPGDLRDPFETLSSKLSLNLINYDLEISVPPADPMRSKAENSVDIYSSIGALSPLRLVDARFWTTLAIKEFSEFSRIQWPEFEKESVISNHWFARTSRELQRDHVIASEWWVGSISHRISENTELSQLSASAVINSNSDFRSQLLGRPKVFSSTRLASSVIKLLGQDVIAGVQYSRQGMRSFLAEVNFKMGRRSLGSLTQEQVDRELKNIWNEIYTR